MYDTVVHRYLSHLVLRNAVQADKDRLQVKFDWKFYIDRLSDLHNRNLCIAISLRQRLDRGKLVPQKDLTSKYFSTVLNLGCTDPSEMDPVARNYDLKGFRKLRDELTTKSTVYQEKLHRAINTMTRETESNQNLLLKRSEERHERAFVVRDLRDDINAKFSEIERKRKQVNEMKIGYEKIFNELVALHASFSSADHSPQTPASPLDGMRRNIHRLLLEHRDLVNQQIFMRKQLNLFEVRLKATKIELGKNMKKFDSILADAYGGSGNLVHAPVGGHPPAPSLGFLVEQDLRGDQFFACKSGEPVLDKSESEFLTAVSAAPLNGLTGSTLYHRLVSSNLPQSEIAVQRSRILHLLGREFFAHWKDAQTMFSLSEALQHMATLRDIDKAVQFVMRAICKLTECDRASYWVIDKAKGIAWTKVNTFAAPVRVHKHEDDLDEDAGGNSGDEKKSASPSTGLTTLMVPINSGLVGAAFKSGQILNIPDAYADPRFNRHVDLRTEYRTKSVLCYPIVYQGQVLGVTQCINKIAASASTFSDSDLAVVKSLGNAMLSVLSSCHSHEEAKKQNLRRAVLVDSVEEMISRMRNRKDLLGLVSSKFKQLFKSDDCHVALVYKDFYAKVRLDPFDGSITMVDADRDLDHGGLIHDCAEKQMPVHLFGKAALAPFAARLGKADSDFLKTGCLDMELAGGAGMSQGDVSVHSWPLFSSAREGQVSAVFQWVCLDRSVIGFGDDGAFNEQNSVHLDLVGRFVKYVGFFVERFWPSNYRLVWNKAKHLQLKVRGLVAFSFASPKRAARISDEHVRSAPPPSNKRYVGLWKRGKDYVLGLGKFQPVAEEVIVPPPKVAVSVQNSAPPSVEPASNFLERLRQEKRASMTKRASLVVKASSLADLESATSAAWVQRKSLLFSDLSALANLRVEPGESGSGGSESSSDSSSSSASQEEP